MVERSGGGFTVLRELRGHVFVVQRLRAEHFEITRVARDGRRESVGDVTRKVNGEESTARSRPQYIVS